MQRNEMIEANNEINLEPMPRQAYEAPELIAYNQSQITKGGANPALVDFVGGGTTNYKS